MFATYKNNLYKYWNIKVYYRLNAFWDKIYTSLHIEGNVLNGSLKFTKYNKSIIWFVIKKKGVIIKISAHDTFLE